MQSINTSDYSVRRKPAPPQRADRPHDPVADAEPRAHHEVRTGAVRARYARHRRLGQPDQSETRGPVGALARWLILRRVRRTSRYLADDLRHYVEHGAPSPRKLGR